MDGASQPGAEGQQARPSNKRLQQTQAQVDEVVGIMKVYISFLSCNKCFDLGERRKSP